MFRTLALAMLLSGSAQAVTDSGAKVYSAVADSVLFLIVEDSSGKEIATGSAFVIEGGLLVTNHHVVAGGTAFVRSGAFRIRCTLVRSDTSLDIAILKPEVPVSAKPLLLATALPPVGSSIFALGNPEGFERTITNGLYTGSRQIGDHRLLQLSAPLSPGSSGGPVVNTRGEVIGIATSSHNDGQSLNFAVPASELQTFLQSAAQAVPERPRSVLVPKLLGVLEASELKYEKVRDGLWGVAYEGKNLPSFMVHVEAADGMVIVWSRVLEKATLSTDVMRALLRASFNANFSKVAIDANGDVIALSELPEDFTAPSLVRAVEETADLAEQTAGLLGAPTTAPNYDAAIPNAPATAGVGARVATLGGAFEITYNPAKWQAGKDDPRVMVHHSGEAWFWPIDERSEITLDGLRDAAIRNAQSSGNDFKLDGESSRRVNGLAVRVIRYSGTASTGLKATFVSQLYSDSKGSLQIVCWTSSNLFRDYEADCLEVFAGFNRVR